VLRWVFWCLALANLGVFLWATGHRPEAPRARPRPPIQADKMALRPSAVPSRPASSNCYAVGPFPTRRQAEFAADYLGQLGLPYRLERRREEVVEGYRVLAGPYPTAAAAEAAYRRLSAQGLRGHYVVRAGARHAVALGYFTEESKAERYLAQLRAQGVAAHIRVRTAPGGERFWLQAGPVAGGELLPRLQALDWGVPQARVLSRPCGAPPAG